MWARSRLGGVQCLWFRCELSRNPGIWLVDGFEIHQNHASGEDGAGHVGATIKDGRGGQSCHARDTTWESDE